MMNGTRSRPQDTPGDLSRKERKQLTGVSRSRIPHNITILALDGKELKSVNIKARER